MGARAAAFAVIGLGAGFGAGFLVRKLLDDAQTIEAFDVTGFSTDANGTGYFSLKDPVSGWIIPGSHPGSVTLHADYVKKFGIKEGAKVKIVKSEPTLGGLRLSSRPLGRTTGRVVLQKGRLLNPVEEI